MVRRVRLPAGPAPASQGRRIRLPDGAERARRAEPGGHRDDADADPRAAPPGRQPELSHPAGRRGPDRPRPGGDPGPLAERGLRLQPELPAPAHGAPLEPGRRPVPVPQAPLEVPARRDLRLRPGDPGDGPLLGERATATRSWWISTPCTRKTRTRRGARLEQRLAAFLAELRQDRGSAPGCVPRSPASTASSVPSCHRCALSCRGAHGAGPLDVRLLGHQLHRHRRAADRASRSLTSSRA